MARCPKCKEELDHLDVVVDERNLCRWTGEGEFSHKDAIDHNIVRWKCPMCYEELPIEPDEDSAAEFLFGGED